MGDENSAMAVFNEAVLNHEAAWWQMELPSGEVLFGDEKAHMLGMEPDHFKKYQDFTSRLHEEDYQKAMNAMKEHISGKKEFYELVYRIKNSKGEYIKFYDCGKITEKNGENITLMGFVMKVKEDKNFEEQMESFRNMILHGKESVMNLVSELK